MIIVSRTSIIRVDQYICDNFYWIKINMSHLLNHIHKQIYIYMRRGSLTPKVSLDPYFKSRPFILIIINSCD